jgi:hypothetical protein
MVHPGFMWVPPNIHASPNFRATAQAAPCDSFDGDPQETQKDPKVTRQKPSAAPFQKPP